MSISYSSSVARSGFGKFLLLLFRWKGSVYKLIWKEFIIFVIIYYILAAIYKFALDANGKKTFEAVCQYFSSYNSIPISIAVGFYANFTIERWYSQFPVIPWPDKLAIIISTNVVGTSDKARMIRRTIARYAVTALVIVLSSTSSVVKRRFPRFKYLADAGFLLPNELKDLKEVATPHNKFFVPIIWACNLLESAKKEGFIKTDGALKSIFDELNAFRAKLTEMLCHDRVSLPLVYTQVTTLIVYTYFLSQLMGQQFLSHEVNQIVPILTFLQFYFFLGWLKVAEYVINQFEDDDDDFEINKLIDRNLQMSYLIVDSMYMKHPEIQKDMYWDMEEFEIPMFAPLKMGCAALACCNDHPTNMFREDHGLWKDMYLSQEVLEKLRKVRGGIAIPYFKTSVSSYSLEPGTRRHISIADIDIVEVKRTGYFRRSSVPAMPRYNGAFEDHGDAFLAPHALQTIDIPPAVPKEKDKIATNQSRNPQGRVTAVKHEHNAPLVHHESLPDMHPEMHAHDSKF